MIARNPLGTEGFQPSTRAKHPRSGRLRVLIIGGYGTFGGRLAELLCNEPKLSLLIAGRSAPKAAAFCDKLPQGAHREPVELDRDRKLAASLESTSPDIVVDASGPFQAYGDDPYRVIEAALATGANYVDLADSPEFVRGIAKFDATARQRGLFVLSGASSFPALSHAMVRALARDLKEIDSIEGGIAPSPYAGVGFNVIRAIAGYAGQPVSVRCGGQSDVAFGLVETRRYTVAPPGAVPLFPRQFSLVNVPDLQLLVDEWPEVQSVWMGAAPQPAFLHYLLRRLAKAVSLRLAPSLSPIAGPIHRIANTVRWGEHRGGMFVEVTGKDACGEQIRRSSHLVAEGTDGLYIPSMAVEAIVRNCMAGRTPAAGARPASSDIELDDYRRTFSRRAIILGKRGAKPATSASLHEKVLGDAWESLPPALRAMHGSGPRLTVSGEASVTRGRGALARLLAFVLKFPKASDKVAVSVTFERFSSYDKWTRNFGGQIFTSTFTCGAGRYEHLLCERFGPIVLGMALVPEGNRLDLVIRRWGFLGIPLPRFLAPGGESFEYAEDGRFCFDVEIRLPLAGFVIRYKGHLNLPRGKGRGSGLGRSDSPGG